MEARVEAGVPAERKAHRATALASVSMGTEGVGIIRLVLGRSLNSVLEIGISWGIGRKQNFY